MCVCVCVRVCVRTPMGVHACVNGGDGGGVYVGGTQGHGWDSDAGGKGQAM